eukprot:SAG31_NODE_26454_length_442_cov_0.641399_2_plen_71_part_01
MDFAVLRDDNLGVTTRSTKRDLFAETRRHRRSRKCDRAQELTSPTLPARRRLWRQPNACFALLGLQQPATM